MTVIDFRTYPVQTEEFFERSPEARAAVRDVFGFYCATQPLTTLIHQLDEAGVDQTVLSTLDCTSAHGTVIARNESIAELVEQGNGRLLGFASVDPSAADAAERLRTAVEQLGLAGLNLDPALQSFSFADDAVLDLFAAADELQIPVTVQMGLNWAPIARTGASRPTDLEEIVQRHPELDVVIAHCAWPWVDEALAMAIKYRNILLDTAVLWGGRPESSVRRVFAEQIGTDVVEASLRDQIVFASDYPRVDPKRVARGIRMLELRPLTEQRILGGNAERIMNRKGNR
ncbi:hypothetical protein BOH66_14885 [Microbacterium aurum]|uniref:Amidohydrolase-related domain-containing protein n=1 Tax=Microbacterium aurum TaxID=36805 RepID=A0A1P8UB83_9MICO|nr:amidohydrolase family protein [Microbacterium aurum]APZ35387.1 hypothetical protein BOH66_14885 [Microbacterium aurum]MBM7826043.1 putative TIM-barrel fold metal-dependent hydrolase [Microbacterium aurum]